MTPRPFPRQNTDSLDVVTTPSDFEAVKQSLLENFEIQNAEISMEPSTSVEIAGREAETMLKMNDALEDLDDVQNVYSNFDISEEEMAKLL